MTKRKSKAKELLDKGSEWFFLTRKGWINRLIPLVSGVTTIYTIFMFAALFKIVKTNVDSYLVLIGFTNLFQLFALPVLKLSKLESSQLCLVYLVINGLSLIGLIIVTFLTMITVVKTKSYCPMQILIIDSYGLAIIALEVLVFLEYKSLLRPDEQISIPMISSANQAKTNP
ncbi:uncharacterized protein LOC107368013 [Tetranychus urticae]|uniref:Uncharacterized protein n=1 Tax=Tetranychus urticae TaxID=32264 RepID=T1KWY6_TETUR|nr:uncharacterized protein LOC107368013 [Tetranychus urticae]